MSKFVVAGLLWRFFKYPKYGLKKSDVDDVEKFVKYKIGCISAKYGLTQQITESQKEDTLSDFWEALFNPDGVFLKNVRAKYYKSDEAKTIFTDDGSININEIQKKIEEEEEEAAKKYQSIWEEFEKNYLNTCILRLLEKNADPVTKEKLIFKRELVRFLKKQILSDNEFEKLYYGPNKAGYARYANTTLLGNHFEPVKYASEEEYKKRHFVRIMPEKENGRAQNKNLKENVIDLLNVQPPQYYFEDILIGKYLYQPQNIVSYEVLKNNIPEEGSGYADNADNSISVSSIDEAFTEDIEERIIDIELNNMSDNKKRMRTEMLLAGLGEYYLNFPELFTGKMQIKPEHYAMLFPEDTKSKDKTTKIQNFLNKILLGKLLFNEPLKRETTNNRMTAFRKEKDEKVLDMISKTSLSILEVNKLIVRDLFDFYKKVIGE